MGKRRRHVFDDSGDQENRKGGYFTSSFVSLDWGTVGPVAGFAVVVFVVILLLAKGRGVGKHGQVNVPQNHNPIVNHGPDPNFAKANPVKANNQVNVAQNRNPEADRGYDPNFLNTAALEAWFGQDKELAATCERTLKFLKDTKIPAMAERAAKICSLRPLDEKIHQAALMLARRAVELGTGNEFEAYFQMALGMAEYRSGNYALADEALLAASQLGNDKYAVSCTSAFYRAMCLFRQGKEVEARKLAAEAIAKMKPLPANQQNPLVGNANADDLILWMASKETKELLELTR
jgi:hypothetical protein